MRRLLLAVLAVVGTLGASALSLAQTVTTVNLLSPTSTQWSYGSTPISLQVTAADNSIPSGLVTYSVDGGSAQGLGGVDQNGDLNVSLNPIDVGAHTILFVFQGNSPYGDSSLTLNINIIPNTLSLAISTTQTSFVYGAGGPQVNVNVSGGAHTGILTLYADGTTLASTGTFVQDSYIFGPETTPPGGMHNIYVVFTPSNGDTLGSTSNSIPITVATATPNMLPSGAPNPVQVGNAPTLTLRMTEPGNWSAALPTGTVDFSEGSTDYGTYQLNLISSFVQVQINGLGVGSHTITMTYSGDGNFSPGVTTYVEVVQPITIQTTTSLSTDQASYAYNQPVQATVSISSGGYGTPTGAVVVDDGVNQVGSGTLTNGQAVLTLSGMAVGSHNLVAIYQPTGSFAQSASPTTPVSVQQASTSLNVVGPGSTTYGQPITFLVTVAGAFGGAPTGSVSVSDGTTTYGPFALSGSVATCLYAPSGAGSKSLTFTYSGDTNFLASGAGTNVSVAKAVSQVTLSNLVQTYSAQPESAGVTTNPTAGVTLTYNGLSTPPTNAGVYTVVATVTDPNYTGSATGTLTINKAPLSIAANNASKFLHAPNPTFTGTVTGLFASDGITVSYSSTATTASDVGSYPIVSALNDPNHRLGNYTVTQTGGTLTITYAGTSGLLGELSGGSTSWVNILPLPILFTVYDANHNAVTTDAVTDLRIISINGVATNQEGATSGSAGWYVLVGVQAYLLNLSPLVAGRTYGYEVILKDGSTLKFTVSPTKL